MCGIMGYIGEKSAQNVIYAGLKRLEYRGYDSAGIAVIDKKKVITSRAVGSADHLKLDRLPEQAHLGIGHTRWATHGKPSESNAHPHTFGKVTLVHNGIIENYEHLREAIDARQLKSQTDSEVLAATIDKHFTTANDLLTATQLALEEVKGTFGVAIISPLQPEQIMVARRGSPIVIGVGKEQYYIASDAAAIVDHTDKVIYLEDDQIARITRDSLEIFDLKLRQQNVLVEQLAEAAEDVSLGKFGSYLEKEIHEQPSSLINVMRGRVSDEGTIRLGGPNLSLEDILGIQHILIIGCGTAYYAGYYAKYKLEEMLGIPVSVEHASEFRYRYGAYDADTTLAIFMSQSGETADTLASLREAKRRRMKTLGIVNSVGSTIAREVSHGGIYLHAGLEMSVASTKAYSSMVAALLMLGGYMTYKRGDNSNNVRILARELQALPREVEATLLLQPQINKIAANLHSYHDWYYLGRGDMYPVALEGALKITELAYVHAQAFPSGEMKHGPISLIDKNHLSVLLLPEDNLLYQKSLSALEEIKARGGTVLTISTRPKEKGSDHHIELAHTGSYTDGLNYNICLQLLALAIATKKRVNIDRPRNLAKSVTVE